LTPDPHLTVRLVGTDWPDFVALVSLLDAELEARYPGLAEDEPAGPDDLIAAVVAFHGDVPVGCGALRVLERGVGEVKRMFVAPGARRLGAARRILEALEARAATLGFREVRLGTGVRQPEAIALYEAAGYQRIEGFGEYAGTDQCVCFAKALPAHRD